jgi:cyclophilin family peptidyl-prolyl cis-trans isomerase
MTASKSAVLLVAAVAAAGCQKKTAIEQLNSPAPAQTGDPVKLETTVAKPNVALGDDIVFHFKLTNAGTTRVQVNVPRIDERSVSFRVRRADGSIAIVSRNHADIDLRTGRFIYEAGDAKTLEPGASLEQDVSTVAVEAGKLAFTPSYVRVGAPAALAASTIDVTVTPADPAKPRLGVVLDTTHGSYTAVLRPDVSYNTVESFASLVKRGFYTALKFHRIIAGFMAQGGDPKGNGSGGPGYFLPLDDHPDKLPHRRGVLSMARNSQPVDTAGSQFFIMFAANGDLDRGHYTTFGEMVDGEETLKKLEAVKVGRGPDPQAAPPLEPVVIRGAKLVDLP